MTDWTPRRVAVVGAGLVGSGWAVLFARAGLDVMLFDSAPDAAERALTLAQDAFAAMHRVGLVDDPDACLARLHVADTLAAAVAAVDYVQESVLETVAAKTAIARDLDALLPPDVPVGSSSSGIPASAFTADLAHRDRFYVVHPVNPPHLVPLVEIAPAPWSDPARIPALLAFLERVGQRPIVVAREVQGFILNRLQGALLNEAWALYRDGYASLADIDRTIVDGLATRWSFMGPFETIDLNAPGGVADYARRLAPLYHDIAVSRADPEPWSDALIARVEAERRRSLATEDLPDRRAWRDARLLALRAERERGEKDACRRHSR